MNRKIKSNLTCKAQEKMRLTTSLKT